MAVAEQHEVSPAGDIRRWVAFRAYGAKRLLLVAQSALDDVEGAVLAGQHEVAMLRARVLVLECLSVRSLARTGDVDASSSVSFDPFAGLSEDEVAEGLALIELDDDPTGWVQALADYLAETEDLLGYDPPLPVLRSPEGTFGALRLAREWSPVLRELNLPDLLPDVWTQPQS